MSIEKISIIIPVFNEEKTIISILNKVSIVNLTNNLKKEIIIINDGSIDNTHSLITQYLVKNESDNIIYKTLNQNNGKGFAIQDAIKLATGDYVLIQDADLEYAPKDYNVLINPVITNEADIVFGSRYCNYSFVEKISKLHALINSFISYCFYLSSGMKTSDVETCYKLLPLKFLKEITLKERGFGIEIEISHYIANSNLRFTEVPIQYSRRDYKAGKKIKFTDGLKAMYLIIRNGFSIKTK